VVAATQTITGPGTTWYIRTDGGTRYSANVTTGQCDGKADSAYPGTGTNQHCAFNDFRYLWDDNSGAVGSGAWVIAGGDTLTAASGGISLRAPAQIVAGATQSDPIAASIHRFPQELRRSIHAFLGRTMLPATRAERPTPNSTSRI
jgi:hypothetical protein